MYDDSPLFICFIYLFDLVIIQAFFSNEGMCGCTKLPLNKADAMKVRFLFTETFFV